MHPFPHRYRVQASAGPEDEVSLDGPGLASIKSLPPVEFDGPGDRWSPETLLCASLADCLLMTFRVVARLSKLPWIALEIEVEGLLEREQGNSHFTAFTIDARLKVPEGTDLVLAERALHKAESGCLISNSLLGRRELRPLIQTVPA